MINPTRGSNNLIPTIALYAAVVVFVLIASVTTLPTVVEQSPNSGVFAYGGTVLLDGGVLYRDIWDNKPPVVFFLDALIFTLLGPTRTALWILDTAFLIMTALFYFWLLRAYHRTSAWSILGVLLFIIIARHPRLIEGGNYTEGYALLFQVACLVAGWRFLTQADHRWAALIGLSASAAFLTKQTTIGVALAFIPALVLSRHPVIVDPRRWRWLLTIIIVGLTPLMLVVGILASQGLLGTAYDALFISPGALHYWISGGPTPVWQTVWTTLSETVGGFYLVAALPILMVATIYVLCADSRAGDAGRDKLRHTFRFWVLLTFLFDLMLVNLSNRGYGHYYLTLLPAFVFVLTIGLEGLARLPQPGRSRRLLPFTASVYLMLVFGYVFVATALAALRPDGDLRRSAGPILHPAASALAPLVEPGDHLLVWGATSTLNFQTRTRSPMRYATAYPVISPGYTQRLVPEIIADLDTSTPLVIVDTTRLDGDRIPPLDPDSRETWWSSGGRRDIQGLEPLYDHVARNCELHTVTPDDVYIYICP